MANTKAFQYKRSVTESVVIKGLLSEDATTITYTEDKMEKTANIKDYLDKFAGENVEFKIGIRSDEDLLADE